MSNCQSDSPEKEMIDTVFLNCDQDSKGRVSIAKLLNYLKKLIGNNSERQHELEELSSLFTSLGTEQTIDLKAYRQAMDEWMSALHQPGENSSELLTQIEGLHNHNNQLSDDILRYRQQWETAEEALATALQENIELIKKIKRLQRVADKKESIQKENEELKASMGQALEKHADEKKHYTKEYKIILKKNVDLENKLEQNLLDYQQCELKIQDLKVEHSRMWEKKKREIEKLTDKYEQEIIKLKTELKTSKEQEISLELTNKELKREKQDVEAQLMQLQNEQKTQSCKKMPYSSLPNAIEEDFDKSLIDNSNRFDEMSDKVLHNTTVKALSQELEGMVDGSLPSPICEREHLSFDMSTMFSADTEDSLCSSLKGFKDILISTIATAVEIKDQFSEFKISDFNSNNLSNCNGCREFRMKVSTELSQYQDWLSLLLNKKTEVDVWSSQLVKILKVDNSLKKNTRDNADLKIVHDFANDNNMSLLSVELKEFETLCVTLSNKLKQLNANNTKHDENIEEIVWSILRKHFLLESGDNQQTNSIRANLAISEKCQRAELKSHEDHQRNSKGEHTLKSKHESLELEKGESPHSSSTELWKDEIGKEIEALKQQLHKKQAVFAALNSGRLSHSWPHQRSACSCQTTPPPTPLVDALTIDLFDSGSLNHRNNKAIETLRNLTNSETYNRDHATSCPALDDKSNLVANATQTDRLGCHFSYGHLNSSNSSSTSGVIDVDFCSSSSRSQDGQKKRKNFIRSSHRFESDSQTSQSMESNPETNISLPRQRSPSFRAAIENHSSNRLQPGAEDANLIKRNNSFMAAVSSHGANNQQHHHHHNETVHLTRNRSLSFQAAIEDGQQSPVAENNDIDFISTSADTTPENQNISEGYTLDTHGRVVPPSSRQDSRSVNFQLSHVNSYSGVDLQAFGNLQQSSKTVEDSKNSYSSHNSQKKSEEWKKTSRTVPNPEVEVTYASPTASIESSGSDVPKKSCIRDSSQRLNSSTEGVQSSSTNETSPSKPTSTAVTMESSSTSQPSSPRQIHSRTRRINTHTMDAAKETLTNEEKSDPKMLKLTANKEKLLSLQKEKEAMSTSTKAAGDVATSINLESLETPVKDTNKPDDISNNAIWAPDSSSQLSKLREPSCLASSETNSNSCLNVLKKKDNNLARKREQMKHMKMPELTELAENPSEGSETSKSISVANSSVATFTQPPPPTDNMVLPSIPDSFLMELGLFVDQYANFCCEDLSEQETENKFLSLSLAFKTDKLTLNQRLQIQKNSRDLAEENIQKELNSLKEVSESMVQQTNDPQVRESVNNIQHYVEILQQAVARISGRAEVFGAVQQEQRMSQAMEVMLAYVDNLKRVQERDHLELEEAKKALTENKIMTVEDGGDSSTLPRRTASLFNTPSKNVHRFKAITATSIAMASAAKMMETAKRRASVAAVSKNPVPVGSTNPGNQASMGILSRQEVQHRRSTLPAGRLLRRVSSFERSSTIYDESSSDREVNVDRQITESKDEDSDKTAFQKGFKKGLGTQVNSMIDNLATQQSCMVQQVQQMMANNDIEDAPEEKLTVLSEVIADIQNDVISTWNGLTPFTQYASIGFFFFIAMFAIILPLLTRYSPFGKINFQVTNKYYTGPPT